MPFGSLATMLPIKLGGSSEEGWTAAQHARLCADLLAVHRTAPIAVVQVTTDWAGNSAAIDQYITRATNGTPDPELSYLSGAPGWNFVLTFPSTSSPDGGADERIMFVCHSSKVTPNGTTGYDDLTSWAKGNTVKVVSSTSESVTVTVIVYGSTGTLGGNIGDYGGSLSKRDDETENPTPYAGRIYRDLQQQRGSAYTQKPGTLVHVENVAIARQNAAIGYRLPDKFTNNAIGPAHSDEGLPYWSSVLALPKGLDEAKTDIRHRAAIHARPAQAPNYDNMTQDFRELLGDVFVSITLNHDGQLETPPTDTYWPVINPGSPSNDIGGGAWLSLRSQIIINVQRPGGMSESKFNNLVNVELFQLVDRMIPAWCTAKSLEVGQQRVTWGSFDWADGTTWVSLFDWDS